MSIKTTISCETFGCHAELNSWKIMTKKEVTEILKEYKWVKIMHRDSLPNHSHHCPDCVRNKRI